MCRSNCVVVVTVTVAVVGGVVQVQGCLPSVVIVIVLMLLMLLNAGCCIWLRHWE
jgi:hypothetical protein